MDEDTVGVLTAVVAVVTLPLGTLTYLFAGTTAAVVVFVVGWFLLTPLIPIVGGTLADRETAEPDRDPIQELRERYARGEIDEVEFERRVERLVETEDVAYDPTTGSASRRGDGLESNGVREREYERE